MLVIDFCNTIATYESVNSNYFDLIEDLISYFCFNKNNFIKPLQIYIITSVNK